MHYLLAPFPPNKTLTAQEPKITFWSNLIKTSSQELRRPLFTERELQARFKWNEVTSPSCLSHVISSMERIREVTKMSEIRQAVQQERVGWVSWGVGMIGKPVSWAVKNYLSSGAVNVDEEYVVVATVKVSKMMKMEQLQPLWLGACMHSQTKFCVSPYNYDTCLATLRLDSLPLLILYFQTLSSKSVGTALPFAAICS